MLETYEALPNLSVVQFAKLAGKSRDQINREIKAGKLLALSVGNRGQRIPDWQLNPVKGRLVQAVLQQARGAIRGGFIERCAAPRSVEWVFGHRRYPAQHQPA